VVCTFVVYFAVAFGPAFTTFQQWGDFVATATMICVYAPATLMVLRRPNEGPVLPALDRVWQRVVRRSPRVA
jgi:hypothetical protein